MKFAWIFATLYLLNGFSVGDELGFNESLSTLEGNKRRSANARAPTSSRRDNRIVVQNAPLPGQPRPRADVETIQQNATTIVSTPSTNTITKKHRKMQQLNVIKTTTPPPFKPIPAAIDPKLIIGTAAIQSPTKMIQQNKSKIADPIPEFHAMPASVIQAYTAAQQSFEKVDHVQSQKTQTATNLSPNNLLQRVMNTNHNSSGAATQPLNLAGLSPAEADIIARKQALKQKQAAILAAQAAAAIATSTTTTTTLGPPPLLPQSPVRTGVAAQTPTKHYATPTSKVMNAPKEYYPVGYDKNFDDNFVSRVELPETSFYCGDQKHFPGLYADEDLGCMVFHVCALTDDGLIMKSFLCPESTLFDQTILKCNWWFYVDCKNSKSLYDSNIPISKSYQLMKALTFFSSIKKDASKDAVSRDDKNT